MTLLATNFPLGRQPEQQMRPEFIELLTELVLATPDAQGSDAVDCLTDLTTLAESADERALLASAELVVALRTEDERYVYNAQSRLAGLEPDTRLAALAPMTDLSLLGQLDERREILEPALRLAHPALALWSFLDAPSARTFGVWREQRHELSRISSREGRELAAYIGWSLLDVHLEHRVPTLLQEIELDAFAPTQGEPGAGEWEVLRLCALISVGRLDRAVSRVERLAPSLTWPCRRWLRNRVTALTPLTAPVTKQLLAAVPGGAVQASEATCDEHRAADSFLAALSHPKRIANVDGLQPWQAFGFVTARLRCASAVSCLMSDRSRAARWPWSGRVTSFIEGIVAVPVAERLRLLAVTVEQVGSPEARAALLTLLEGDALAHAPGLVADGTLLRLGFPSLPIGLQQISERNWVWRAVVDGSNVGFGGESSKSGGAFRLNVVDAAVAELKQSGFRDVHVFFDRTTQWKARASDWAEIERRYARREVTVTEGVADRHVIECFLQQPGVSWIVTSDRYRDHTPDYPALRSWWPASRIAVHVTQTGSIGWSRSLKRPAR